MDGSHFDALTRSLTTAGPRRRALGGLLLGSLGLLGWRNQADEARAKKGKRKKKKKKKRSGFVSSPPPGTTCTPNCFDRVCGPDGCGGSCGQCPLVGQLCERGACACPADKPEVCDGACEVACTGTTVRHPETCRCCIPSRSSCGAACEGNCCSGIWSGGYCNGLGTGSACTFDEQCSSLNCVHGRCEECYDYANFCYYGYGTRGYGTGSDICGPQQTGQCLKTVDGPPRCGVRAANVECNGCSSDVDCLEALGQDTGTFCVRDTGPHCDCPDGQTFCARPK